MQKQMQDLYRELEKDGIVSFKDAKNVGDAVFSALLKNIKKPPALILKVKGLGDFFLRRKKLIEHYNKQCEIYNGETIIPEILDKDRRIPGYIDDKREMITLIGKRLEEYTQLVDKKLKTREERKEFISQLNKDKNVS